MSSRAAIRRGSIVVVGFSLAQRSCEWSERVGGDDLLCPFGGEAGGFDEASPAVVLGGGGAGFVGGWFGAGILEHPEQHSTSGDFID
ncbi:hypothetical protein FHU41_000714 [Psychromicrobium silvestre]|uniref:Uncharacterized protein n=1 Tax=Psychromicrobium silvestre TaxID=1645614 RepID=A0A7Y9LRX6_9MICC|nr:hypothetical protein [Psychromicrobium silvestre]NYE94493.1 hypothetical protein [Psychromicrobium silvestre]